MTAPGPVGGTTADDVLALATSIEQEASGSWVAEEAAAVRQRMSGPLRVAIAGRVKAGKSTLLNALVGERLAPTDAGECTRIVAWYRQGSSYDVTARLKRGGEQNLAFTRDGGMLDIQLGGLRESEVEAIDVHWPASTLADVTLIDTPGLASLDDENSRRTREFLEIDSGRSSDADAVIYLMRHLHSTDVEFLDAFMDRSVTAASPVNAVAVLSRADEIGAGRLDAMESAGRIAARYEGDPEVRSLCATVVPLAGLLAETGLTLREDEAASLRALVATDQDVLERMLLSADQFCDMHSSDLTVEIRRDLLDRLGLFGVRLAVQEVAAGRATTAASLAPRLVEDSGLRELQRVIAEHFLPRSRVLQARSALTGLRSLARSAQQEAPALAERIDREAERIEAGALEFGRFRALHLVVSGTARTADGEQRDLEQVLLGATPASALGLPADADVDAVQAAALSGIERWRSRSNDPLAAPALVEVYETAARTCETLYAMQATAGAD